MNAEVSSYLKDYRAIIIFTGILRPFVYDIKGFNDHTIILSNFYLNVNNFNYNMKL